MFSYFYKKIKIIVLIFNYIVNFKIFGEKDFYFNIISLEI